jgi:HAD superfamily hydrolase (TIGR01509 family)
MTLKQKAIIFDMDGVIVNTETLKARAHVATVEQLGGRASTALYAEVMGRSYEAVSMAFISSSGISCDFSEYRKIYGQTYYELLDKELDYMPGMPDFIKIMAKCGYSLGLVSSSSSGTIDKISRTLEFDHLFKYSVSAEDVEGKKPSPEPYLLALQLADVTSENAVVFEDSESGVISAHKAGIAVISIRHAFNRSHDFSYATHTIDSFLDASSIAQLIKRIWQ